MFILNSEEVQNVLKFNRFVGKYIEEHGGSILAREEDVYVFKDTPKLREILDKVPWFLYPLKRGY